MDKRYADPFDTQVTPEESEALYTQIDEDALREAAKLDKPVRKRPLPASIEEIIEDDDEMSFG